MRPESQMILMLYIVSLILIDEGNADWYNVSIKTKDISMIHVHNADERASYSENAENK